MLKEPLYGTFFETLSADQRNFLLGFVNFTQKDLELDWDIDQTLAISEDPVKAAVDARFGTNYSARRIDGYNTISKWLATDGLMDPKSALEYEGRLWVDHDILMSAKPNEALRAYSYEAYKLKIPQNVSTVRVPGLRQMTYKWMSIHFPWIPAGKVNFGVGMSSMGPDFKINTILSLYGRNPGLVHIDDDLKIMRPLAQKAERLGLIGIKYTSDDVNGLNSSGNRVFLDRDILNSLVAQSS